MRIWIWLALVALCWPTIVWADATSRVEIDPRHLVTDGSHGGELASRFIDELKYQAFPAGIEVTVGGDEFDQTAEVQDRIHDSGRYDPAMTGSVPRGKMRPPTTIYNLNLTVDVVYSREGFLFSYDQVTVTVSSILNPSGVSSGSFSRGAKAYTKMNHKIWFQGASSREVELLHRAVTDNVRQLVAQLASPPPVPVVAAAPASVVISRSVSGQITLFFPDGQSRSTTLPAGQTITEGQLIKPFDKGQCLGTFTVSMISGQNVVLTLRP